MRGAQLVRRGPCQRHGVVGVLAGMIAGQRLDAADAGGNRAFAGHRDQADIAGAADMGAAAQFDRPAERVAALLAGALAHRDHADLVAVFLAEQRARAGFAGVIHRHQPRGDLVILQHHIVGDVLDAGEFFRRDRLRMHEVEAQPVRRDQRTALRDVIAEHLAQRLVQQMRRRVMGADRGPPGSDRLPAASAVPIFSVPCSTVPRCTKRSPAFFCVSVTRNLTPSPVIMPVSPTWPPDSA